MSGHSKWAQIKRQKAVTDAKRSKVFSKFARLISVEARLAKGDRKSPSLLAVIERAKKENTPNDVIDRAIKKAMDGKGNAEEVLTYEAYGPGGCAIIIESVTGNKNKAVQEIKLILSRNGFSIAGQGSAMWAFTKTQDGYAPNTTVPLSNEDVVVLEKLIDELEENEEVSEVYTNVE